jgi:hypothetical protein
MQVLANNAMSLAVESAPEAPLPKASLSVSIPSFAPFPALQTASNVRATVTPDITLEPLVTFRKDARGNMYYVITDAKSGKEIAQLPPKQLRNVREGIADYLKQQEANSAANAHIEVKA